MRLTVSYKIYLSFGVLLLCLISLGIYSINSLNNVNEKLTLVSTELSPRTDLEHTINTLSSDMRINEYLLIMAQTDEDRKSIEKSIVEQTNTFKSLEKELDKLIVQEKKQSWGEFKEDWKTYIDYQKTLISLLSQNKQKEALQLMQGDSKQLFEKISKDLLGLINYNKSLTKSSNTEAEQIYEKTSNILLYSVVVIFIVTLIVSILLTRNIKNSINKLINVSKKVAKGDLTEKVVITGNDEFSILGEATNQMIVNLKNLIERIQDTAEQVAASSAQLTASSEQSATVTDEIVNSIMNISDSANQQVEQVDDASSIVEEITASVEQVALNAELSTKNALKAVDKANEGNVTLKQALVQMHQIEESVDIAEKAFLMLSDSTKQIGEIVNTISSIATTTNLLAFNAAIEAARAGEHGRGFNVVAQEVRSLAEQSQEATRNISSLIEKIISDMESAQLAINKGKQDVHRGADVMNKGGQAFLSIVELVEDMSNQFKHIANTIEEINVRSGKVISAVHVIDNSSKVIANDSMTISAATEEQSASVQEIAASSRMLSDMAQNLEGELKQFSI